MVSTIAGGETSPLLKTKAASSCHLLHWYVLWLFLAPGVDCNPGPPGVGKKTQSALLSQNFAFQHVLLDDVVRESSDDQTYLHTKFVQDCLRENVEVPIELKINLLERKINKGIEEGKKWSLVHGFPEFMKEVHEFEEKVGLTANKQEPLTTSRCRNQTTLCFLTAQLRSCSSVSECWETSLVTS